MPLRAVTTWTLEMPERPHTTPRGHCVSTPTADAPDVASGPHDDMASRPEDVRIDLVPNPSPEFARYLYAVVGGPWTWTDRLGWTREQWLADLGVAGTETYVAYVGGEPAGETVLFFGCQHPDWDDLYAEEFATYEAAGTLRVHRAYSRKPDGEVRYVQHRLWAERDSILDLIEQGAHVYVCGDVTGMGPAVEETLTRIGQDVHGPNWLTELSQTGRYATDLF